MNDTQKNYFICDYVNMSNGYGCEVWVWVWGRCWLAIVSLLVLIIISLPPLLSSFFQRDFQCASGVCLDKECQPVSQTKNNTFCGRDADCSVGYFCGVDRVCTESLVIYFIFILFIH